MPAGKTFDATRTFNNIREHEYFGCDMTTNTRHKGAVATFLSNTYPATRIPIGTPLQAVATSLLQILKVTAAYIRILRGDQDYRI